jgi:uncharacterized membrane protein HdeD (DUF308 family)
MSANVSPNVTSQVPRPKTGGGLRAATRELTGLWWMWLIAGIAWIVISLVILQFDSASVTTVGVLVGGMFALAAFQNFAAAAVPRPTGVVSAIFGAVFLVSSIVCFVDPTGTFAALADTLGFLFVLVGIWWMVRAFLDRAVYPLWWLGLIAGILMTVLGFWTAGQFFVEKAYVLLVFAGVWAMLEGVMAIVRALWTADLHADLKK